MPKSKVIVPNVVRGGIAIPLKNMTNYYYMLGRSHENGGIDIGKDVEVQGGELVQTTKDAIKVFSDEPFSDPPFNGKSSSRRVLGGENPNKVFNQQEEFKKRHGLNDDGTQKRMGGPIRNRKQYVTKRDNTYVAPRFVKEEQTGRPISNNKRYTTKLTDNEEIQFQDWYRKVAKYKELNPNPDAVGQDYDYRGYWKNEDREIIFDDKKGHFTDKYKQPTHPTFSNQSIYSNNITPGGEWVEGKGTWLFKHNNYTARQAQRTHDYLMDTGEGYILGTDTIIPTSRKRMGGLSRSKDYYDDGRNNLGVYTTRTDAIRGPQIVQREDLIGDIAKMNRAIQKHEQNLYNSSRPRTDLNFRVSSPTGDVVTNDPSNLWWSNKLHFKRNIPLGILYTDEKGNDVPFYTEAVVTGRRPRKIHEYSSSDIASGVTGGVLNWSSPSQIAGTISDIYNKKPNWSEGMILGNSGFVSDEFMQEHPVYGSLVNLAGDIAITGPKAVSRIPKGVTSLAKNTKKVVTAGRNIGRQAISKIDDIVEQGNNKITAAKNRFNDVVDNLQNQLYPSRQAYVQGLDGNYYSVDDVFGDNYMSFSKRKNKNKRKNTVSRRNNTLDNGTNAADDEIRIPEPDPAEVDNATIFEQANESNAKNNTNTSNVVDDVDDVDAVDDFDNTKVRNNKTNNKNKPLFRRLLRNIWEKEKKPWIGIPTGMGIMGGGISAYHWLNDRESPDETLPINIDETYVPIGNDTTTIPYITPDLDDEIQVYDIEDSIPSKRMGGLSRYKNINANVYSKYPEVRKKAKAGGLYSVTVNGKTSLRRFPSTGERTKAAAGAKVKTYTDTFNFAPLTIPDTDISELTDNPLKLKGTQPIYRIESSNISKYGLDPWGNPKTQPFIPHQPIKPFRRLINNTRDYLKNNPGEVNDLIGLTSNITGGLLSHRINRNMLNKLQYVAPPTPKSAVKLKTRININPQLDRMRENLANYERTINDNTTSSNVALARRNQARLANTMQMNELYGNRENAETQLINQDRTNQQAVANENIADYNKWLEGLNTFRNSIIDKKSENNISLVENINSGIQDLINRREKRRSDNQTIAAMALANPNLPIEIFYNQGFLKKDVLDAYMKAYRNRNKKTTTQQG